MARIVECVPNFSEGRSIRVINAIAGAISAVPGVKFISAEPDKDYNRTVVTFVGEPEAVLEGAFQGTKQAVELIDMSQHHGEHPRIGAADVVPFVPVSGVTMEDCVGLSKEFGARVGGELGIPVYLYEEAATRPERKNLSVIRKGEYEGLAEKLKDPAWAPDFGPAVFNAASGAVVTGARMFLIAYNVNLDTNDVKVASEIALRIRESGRIKKDGKGNPVLDAGGKKIANATVVKVVHNGKVIHENVELNGPTRGPMAEDVKATGGMLSVCGDGALLQSSDGGTSWTTTLIAGADNLNAVQFLNGLPAPQ